MPHERAMFDSEYPADDDQPVRLGSVDPISEAVGSPGFISRHVVEECREPTSGGDNLVRRPAERFDRMYFQPERLLIDIVQDLDDSMLAEQCARKRCAFKERWCRENGWRYVVLPESIVGDVASVRARIAETAPKPAVADAESRQSPASAETTSAPRRKAGRSARGVQRPKAAAA